MKMVIETSRPIAGVARDLGVNEGTWEFGVNKYRQEDPSEEFDVRRTCQAERVGKRMASCGWSGTSQNAAAFFAKETQ